MPFTYNINSENVESLQNAIKAGLTSPEQLAAIFDWMDLEDGCLIFAPDIWCINTLKTWKVRSSREPTSDECFSVIRFVPSCYSIWREGINVSGDIVPVGSVAYDWENEIPRPMRDNEEVLLEIVSMEEPQKFHFTVTDVDGTIRDQDGNIVDREKDHA